ncbi:OLC1v1006194C1 [Oldenlandia corymbosa var. corymbosa]|uniref:OLC1v1006194C1 n=1 Tax=Oldenlandia corymbosa var. corymbosa TaxID=529605 RepID=A0AAV1DGY0_OLDCO|nr:OLC1v1006194C1 [Oldenlandia corymbosa var. corymbosa]
MASLRPILSNFLFLIPLLLLHLGCFIIFTSSSNRHSKKRKLSSDQFTQQLQPSSRLKLTPAKAFSSSWSFIKRVFVPTKTATHSPPPPPPACPVLSPSSSTRSLVQTVSFPSQNSPDPLLSESRQITRPILESDISSDQQFFPLRNDIYPCPACGEIFQNPNSLEQHQSINHAVSELIDGDTGKNIVNIIFNTGWPGATKKPVTHRILKIHSSPKILQRFEEYREYVMSRAARNGGGGGGGATRRRDERCVADGNELLRFHCTTFMCELGQNGDSTLCSHEYCVGCGIIRGGFSPKMDGISTHATSWRAHVSIPEEMEEELFKFMHLKRAMLVCRVIAGRIGSDDHGHDVDKLDPGFDSLTTGGAASRLEEEDELLVFNPRAVLPCFVIVYTV